MEQITSQLMNPLVWGIVAGIILLIIIIIGIRANRATQCATLQVQMQEDAIARLNAAFWVGSPDDFAELAKNLRKTASDYVEVRTKKG